MSNENTSIFRVRKKDNYVSLSNALLRDQRLSFGARGLLAALLSYPPDWEVRFSVLLVQSPAKRTALRSLIKECVAFRYMRRTRLKAEGGRFKWVTEVFEEPYTEGDSAPEAVCEGALQEVAPSVGFPPMEDPSAELPPTGCLPVENLSIKERRKDKSRNHERRNGHQPEATKTTARVTSQPAPPPPPAEKVFILNPFPVDDEMRAWAAKECPLVNIDDATDKFVLQYSPEAVDDPPRYSWTLWLTKWKTWMRREQGFENRDRLKGISGSPPPRPQRSAAEVEADKQRFSSCPDCYGTGMYYPEGTTKGVARCPHARVPRETVAHVHHV